MSRSHMHIQVKQEVNMYFIKTVNYVWIHVAFVFRETVSESPCSLDVSNYVVYGSQWYARSYMVQYRIRSVSESGSISVQLLSSIGLRGSWNRF